jgi:DNA-binding SARP family transcriptional activator/TolB-like protein
MHNPKLALLGGLEIAGSAATCRPLTRKARGMLAYLALQSRHAQSREKLATVFWGGVPDSQARTNLRQALSSLRRALASVSGVNILAEGDQVILKLDGAALDVARFEDLVLQSSTESLEQALLLYRGDLLDGFSLNENAFEDWVAGERTRLRLLATAALEKLVAAYRREGDLGRCLQSAIRLLMLDPHREDMHREVMRIYASQGRMNSALKQYKHCRETLRRELGVSPEPETEALFQELRRHRELPDMISLTSRRPRNAPATALGEATSLSLTIGSLAPPKMPSVVILPFDASGGEVHFAHGVTENIITGLTRFRDLLVIAFPSSRRATDGLSEPDIIGSWLGVAYVVQGSARREGARVRITAQLIEAATNRGVWAEKYDRYLTDILTVQDEITDRIVTTLAGRIESESCRRSGQTPLSDWAAFDHLLQARECMRCSTPQSEATARGHLEAALTLDPRLTAAYAALALSHIHEYESPWAEDPETTIALAFKNAQAAVALDGTDSVARRALAYAAHYLGKHELARKEIESAIDLNPNDYNNLCVKAWIVNFGGYPEEALVCRKQSLRINPLSPDNCLLDIGVALYTMRQYRQSAEAFAQMSSWDSLRHACRAACHAQLGQQREAATAKRDALAAMRLEFSSGDPVEHWLAYAQRIFRFRKPDSWTHLLKGLRKAELIP